MRHSQMTTYRFNEAFQQETMRRPQGYPGRIFANAVILRIRQISKDVYRLAQIETIANKRNGYGSQALDFLCDLADDCGITIVLTPCPLDFTNPSTLNLSQLCDWYKRRGFVEYTDGEFVRFPLGGRIETNKRYTQQATGYFSRIQATRTASTRVRDLHASGIAG